MMDFLTDLLNKYCENHTSEESGLLSDLNRNTHARVMMPRMLSGHLQGRFLSLISHLIKPTRILEIGTYTGYSALCLAEGLAPDGILHTIDINDELESFVRNYFKQSGLEDKIHFHLGNAKEIIPSINEKFDLVFIDADKINYSLYYDLVFPKVKQGGLILADNVLWSGKVTDESAKDKDTQAIKDFNLKVMNDPAVENMLLPLRDGIMMARKL